MPGTRAHVLLAEDEAHTRLALYVVLRKAGYRVTQASDGYQALEQATRLAQMATPPDVLVIDIQMPLLDGVELLAELSRRGLKRPTLIISGYPHRDNVQTCEQVAYLEKPFDPMEFLWQVDCLATQRRDRLTAHERELTVPWRSAKREDVEAKCKENEEMNTAADELETVRRIVAQHRGQRGSVLAMLLDVQHAYGCVPQSVLRKLVRAAERPLTDFLAVAEVHDGLVLRRAPDPELNHAMPQTLVGARCHRCNHSLLDTEQFLADRPAIRLAMASGETHGWFCFAARPGVFAARSEHPVPTRGDVSFYCPCCSAEILSACSCLSCGSPLLPMLGNDGAVTTACSSRSCRRGEEF